MNKNKLKQKVGTWNLTASHNPQGNPAKQWPETHWCKPMSGMTPSSVRSKQLQGSRKERKASFHRETTSFLLPNHDFL